MNTNRTFTMLKPDAVANGYIGAILNQVTNDGFKIIAMKYLRLTPETAGEFYAIHRERPFYKDLVESFNKYFNNVEQIKKFELLQHEWSVDTGELTPKMSLKRKVIMEKYREAVQRIYE